MTSCGRHALVPLHVPPHVRLNIPPAASTLTGWTFNAVRTCFCVKCVRAFPCGISVLQHFQTSARHVATVEALEVRVGDKRVYVVSRSSLSQFLPQM